MKQGGNPEKTYLSLKQAEKKFGYSPSYLSYLLREKKITGKKVFTTVSWLVSAKSLADYCGKLKNLEAQEKVLRLEKEELSLKEAAQATGYAPDYIGYLIRQKKVFGKKVQNGVSWLVSIDELKTYQEKVNQAIWEKSRFAFLDREVASDIVSDIIPPIREKIRAARRKVSYWIKMVRVFVTVTKYGTTVFFVGVIILGSILVWAINEKEETQTIEIYSLGAQGDWQNSQNAAGPPETEETADFESFSEANSASYQTGPLSIVVAGFRATGEDLENSGQETLVPSESPLPTESPASNEIPVSSEALIPSENPLPSETPVPSESPEPTESSSPSEDSFPGEIPELSESPMPSESSLPSETLPENESPIPSESSAPTENPLPSETPAPEETPTPSETPVPTKNPISNESPIPSETPAPTENPTPSETPALTENPVPSESPLLPVIEEQGEPLSFLEKINVFKKSVQEKVRKFVSEKIVRAKEIPTFAELTKKEFVSAKIKLSIALGERRPDLSVPISENQELRIENQDEVTPSGSPEPTESPSPSESPLSSETPTPSESLIPSEALETSENPTPRPTTSPTPTPTETPTPLPTETLTLTPTETPVPTPTSTPTPTPSETPVPTSVPTPTSTPTPTPTETPASTPTPTPTPTLEEPMSWLNKVRNFFAVVPAKAEEETLQSNSGQIPSIDGNEDISATSADPAIEENSQPEILPGETATSEELFPEEITSSEEPAPLLANEAPPNLDDRIIVWYSLDNDTWWKLGTISAYPLSNLINGGYLSFDAPFIKTWDDIQNLQIKLEGVVGGETLVITYLDSVWVEVSYQEKKEEEMELVSAKKDWRADEEPVFEITRKNTKQNTKLHEKLLIGAIGSIFEEEPKIDAILVSPAQEEVVLTENEDFEAETHSPTKITLFKTNKIKPGRYTIKIDYEKDGKTYPLEQDFTWGVLAININKSIYTLNNTNENANQREKAYLQMGVLDDTGHTICDANLKLEITSPDGATKIFLTSSSNPLINTNNDNSLIDTNSEPIDTANSPLINTNDKLIDTNENISGASSNISSDSLNNAENSSPLPSPEPSIPAEPAESESPPINSPNIETPVPEETVAPEESPAPTESPLLNEPTDLPISTESPTPAESPVPTESVEPTESLMPTESTEAIESPLPAESVAPVEPTVENNNEPLPIEPSLSPSPASSQEEINNSTSSASLGDKIKKLLGISNVKAEDTIDTSLFGVIERSSECKGDSVTYIPDYFAYYQVGGPGIYKMELTNLDNGYEIEDSFEVRDSVPFEVERIGPTRIYPPAAYEMVMKIKVNQDFVGQVVESVPADFEIIGSPLINTNNDNPLNATNINTNDHEKIIEWQVDWKAGESYELKYQFDAPDISPYLFLLGPLRFEQKELLLGESGIIEKIKDTVGEVIDKVFRNNANDSNENAGNNPLINTNNDNPLIDTANSPLNATNINTNNHEENISENPSNISEGVQSGRLNSGLVFKEARQWQIAADAISTDAISFGVATASGTAAGYGRNNNGDLTITLPTGWAAGQLAIIVLYSDQGGGSVPVNWTQITGSPWGSATPKLQAFYRFLQAGDANPVTTISGSSATSSHVAAIATYNGVDITTPIEAIGTASAGTGTPMTAGSITTLTGGAWALGLCGRGDNEVAGSQTFNGSATGVTERFDSGTAAGRDSQVSLYDKQIASAGATGNGSSATSATDPWVSVIIALKPAAAQATAYSFQRKTWFDGERHWLAFNSGSKIKFYYSSDGGSTWYENLSASISVATNDFSIEADPVRAFIVYVDGGAVKARKALSYRGISFSWDSATTIALDGYYPTISKDSSNKLWVLMTASRATIRPNANGFASAWSQYPATTDHYDKVDDVSSDGDNTYLYASTAVDELLNLEDTAGASVTSVTAYYYSRGASGQDPLFQILLRTNDTTSVGNNIQTGTAGDYVLRSQTWTTNPVTLAAWTEAEVNALQVGMRWAGGTGEVRYITQIYVVVDYTSNPRTVAVQSTLANDISGWQTATTLDNSANTNRYGVIVPQSSGGNMYAVWIDGTAIEGKKYVAGTGWDAVATSIATGVTGLSNNMSAVTDTTNYYIHLLYINSTDYAVYQEYTTSWQTAVTLDGTAGCDYATISINTSNNDLYAFWTRANVIYYKKGVSPYGSANWDSSATSWQATGTNKHVTSNYSGSDNIFAEWTEGTTSPYTVKWDKVIYVVPSVDITGTVYLHNETTQATLANGGPCNNNSIVSLRVNGGASTTATCSSADASFSFSAVWAVAGDTITIYLTSTDKANTVYVSDGADDTGVDLYIDTVIVRDKQGATITIENMSVWDKIDDATNMLFDASTSSVNLTVDSGKELHIWTGTTFVAPGDSEPTTINRQVGASADDACTDWFCTTMIDSNEISLGESGGATDCYWSPGMRFTNITIPKGATVTSAKLTVYAASDYSATVYSKIYAEDVDNATAFTTESMPVTRTKTTNYATWTISGDWANETWYDSSANIKDPIQEVISRDNWQSGNALNIIGETLNTTPNDSDRRWWAWDRGSAFATKLEITYQVVGTVTTSDLHVKGTYSGTFANLAVNSNLAIDGSAAFVAPSGSLSLTMTVGGNFTNSGTFTHSSGTVTLNGAGGTTQIISGSTTFYGLTASATAARTITFTAGTTQAITNSLTFQGAAGQLLTLSRYGASGVWNINTTGIASPTLNYLSVSNSTSTLCILATNSTNGGGNTNWDFTGGGCPTGIDISGSVKGTDESSFIGNPPCNGTTLVVSLRVNGGTESTIDCDDVTGNYSFTSVSANAGDTVTIYLNSSSTPKANLVMVAGSVAVNDANLFQDRVIVRDEQDAIISIPDMWDWDSSTEGGESNMLFNAVDAATDTLTVNSGKELHVWTGDILDPNGTVTTQGAAGDLHLAVDSTCYFDTATSAVSGNVVVDGGGTSTTFSVGATTTVGGGSITTSSTNTTITYTATPTLTISGTGSIGGGTSPSITFYNLSTSGTGTTTLVSTATTDNNVTVGTTTTFDVQANLNVGANFTNTTTGIITTTAGTPTVTMTGTGNLGGGSGNISFYNLTTSGTGTITFSGTGTNTVNNNVTVGTGTSLNINSSISITGSLINTTTGIIGTSAGTPTVTVSGTSIGGGSGAITFHNLTKAGAGTTTFSGSGTNTVNNDLSVSAGTLILSNTLTVTNNASVATGATLTINANLNIDGGSLTTTTTGIINYTSGTPTVDIDGTGTLGGGSGSITFYSLDLGDGTSDTTTLSSALAINNNLTVNASQIFTVGSNNVTVGSSSVTNSGGISVATSGSFNQTGGTTTILSSIGGAATIGGAGTLTFYNLYFAPDVASAPIFTLGSGASQTINVSGNLTIGNGTNPVAVTISSTYDPTLNVSGNVSVATNGTLTAADGGTLNVDGSVSIAASGTLVAPSTGTFTVAGSWSNSTSGTFTHSSGTVTFDAGATGKTIADGGDPFYKITFNNALGGWTYQDGAATAPNTTTVSNGAVSYINAKVGGLSVTDGTLTTDWYLGVHVVDASNTATSVDTGVSDITIIETATSAPVVWRYDGGWGAGASSQTTGTGSDGKNPQLYDPGAIKLREYSMTNSTACPGAGCTLYNYNLQINWQPTYGQYDYYKDFGSLYVSSCWQGTSSACGNASTVDDTIGDSWHRSTVGSMNNQGPPVAYTCIAGSGDACLNEAPTDGSWYAGMFNGLSFSITPSFSIDMGTINPGPDEPPTNATSVLSVSTSATNGYVVTAWSTQVMTCAVSNQGKCGTETISDWSGTNESPSTWDSGFYGFGYSTDDTALLTGTADRFSGPKFAAFVHTGAGDPVADRSNTQCPCTSQTNTITYRVAAGPTQRPGTYETTVIYVATANY